MSHMSYVRCCEPIIHSLNFMAQRDLKRIHPSSLPQNSRDPFYVSPVWNASVQVPFVVFGWFGPPVSPGHRRSFGSLEKTISKMLRLMVGNILATKVLCGSCDVFFKSRSFFCKIILETVVLFCK